MKIKIKCMLIFFLCSLIFVKHPVVIKTMFNDPKNYKVSASPTSSDEEIYKDILMLLLLPYLTDEVEKQYGKFYSINPSAIKVLEVVRPLGYKTNTFNIKLRVAPYIGPHNAVGLDDITLKIEPEKVTVLNFKHIISYQIPEYLR